MFYENKTAFSVGGLLSGVWRTVVYLNHPTCQPASLLWLLLTYWWHNTMIRSHLVRWLNLTWFELTVQAREVESLRSVSISITMCFIWQMSWICLFSSSCVIHAKHRGSDLRLNYRSNIFIFLQIASWLLWRRETSSLRLLICVFRSFLSFRVLLWKSPI